MSKSHFASSRTKSITWRADRHFVKPQLKQKKVDLVKLRSGMDTKQITSRYKKHVSNGACKIYKAVAFFFPPHAR